MNTPTYFKPWLANWNLGGIIVLFIILLSGVVQFAALGLSQNYVISYLPYN
jgi:DHA2 family multidrug resistance protein